MKRTEVMIVTRDEVLDALRSYGWPIGYSEILRPEINSSGDLCELRFTLETEETVYPTRAPHELTPLPAPEPEQQLDQAPTPPPAASTPAGDTDIPF